MADTGLERKPGTRSFKPPSWLLSSGTAVAIALAGWAHSLLMNHNTRLALLEQTSKDHHAMLGELKTHLEASRQVQQNILIELRGLSVARETQP